MGLVPPQPLEPVVDDPDDYRPASRSAFAVDPERAVDFGVIWEEVAPGDRIPLHRHALDELVLVLDGDLEFTYDGERLAAGAGSTVFVRGGVVHGARNPGQATVRYVAVFASTTIDIDMIERVPKPGTEDAAPSHTEWDMRGGSIRTL